MPDKSAAGAIAEMTGDWDDLDGSAVIAGGSQYSCLAFNLGGKTHCSIPKSYFPFGNQQLGGGIRLTRCFLSEISKLEKP